MFRSSNTRRAVIVAASVLLLTAAYDFIPLEYELASRIAQYLFFLPIVTAALWFGFWGGMATAGFSALCILPRLILAPGESPHYSVEQYGEVLDLLLVGAVFGLLAQRERLRTAELAEATAQLRRTNQQLQENMEHLKRMERLSAIGQLTANLAHEIRNPLASIEGAADLLRPGMIPDSSREEFVEIIKKESRRLNRLLSNMLDYARPRPPSYHPTQLAKLLEPVTALLAVTAEKTGVKLLVEPMARMPDVDCDPEQIKQVLLNIVLNAIQAMPEGGVVTVRAAADANRATITVSDQGPGIDPRDQDKLFSPFFTTKKQGTGLGLAVAQHIITRHNGEILVEPNRPKGTTFSVVLPVKRSEGILGLAS